MISKNTTQKTTNRTQYLHWCNALSAILSVTILVAVSKFKAVYENSGSELPLITEFFVNFSSGLVLIPVVAGTLSIRTYIRGDKKSQFLKVGSIAILLFTIGFSVLCLIAMYIPSTCHCKVISYSEIV